MKIAKKKIKLNFHNPMKEEKDPELAKRFVKFLAWARMDVAGLCELIDGDRSATAKWYRYKSGKSIPNGNTLTLLKKHFPKLNINWLLVGEGEIEVDVIPEEAREAIRDAHWMSLLLEARGVALPKKYEGKAMLPKVELYRIGNPKRVLFTQAWGLDRSQFGSYPARR